MAEPKQILDTGAKEFVEYCRQHPDIAASLLLKRDGRPLELNWYQRITLRGMFEKQFSLLILSRGSGKSFLLAVYVVLKAMLYPYEKCLIMSKSYRQAQFVFDEVVRMWNDSELFQQACKKPPAKSPNECVVLLENNSWIKALPLGDGSAIRGARANTMVCDEFAQMPIDIVNLVILPMLNVKSNPMVQDGRKNHIVFASSAYYRFNHLYNYYLNFKRLTDKNSPDYDEAYGLYMYNYLDAPEGWMDMKIIQHAMQTMPRVQFMMEYLNVFPSDSDGFFPMSLLESSRRAYCLPKLKGDPKKEYVVGIDPARVKDQFGVVIMELNGINERRVVFADTLYQKTFQDMYLYIREILRTWNVVRIHMDAGGGGLTLKDLLAKPDIYYDKEKGQWIDEDPIIDMDDKEFQHARGRRILKMINFAPSIINEMNFDLKSDIEHGRCITPGKLSDENNEKLERIYDNINKMIEQTSQIIAKPNKNGMFSFDIPKQGERKDLYSAWILANNAAKAMQTNIEKEKKPTLPIGKWGVTRFGAGSNEFGNVPIIGRHPASLTSNPYFRQR